MVVPLLIDAAKKHNPKAPKAQAAAIFGLGYLGPKGKAAVPFLIEELEKGAKWKEGDPPNLSGTALVALKDLGSGAAAAIPVLKKIENDPEAPFLFQREAKSVREWLEMQPKK